MKSLRTLISIAVLGIIIALSGCGGKKGNTEPVTDKQLGLLSKTWKVSNVMEDGVDVTSNWTGLTLTISGTKGSSTFNYTRSSGPSPSVWKSAGTFQFDTLNPTQLLTRDDGVKVTYSVDPASANLSMSFSFTGSGYRVSNVSGDWAFKFVPQ